MAGKDLTSGSGRFEKLQAVLRTFYTWLLRTRLESRNSWFETQIYAKTRCNTNGFFASETIKKTSTFIGETFRRESQKRSKWIANYSLVTGLGCCKAWVVANSWSCSSFMHDWYKKKIERWMQFEGNNNLYLKGYHPNRFHWETLNFRRKVFLLLKQNNILPWNSF